MNNLKYSLLAIVFALSLSTISIVSPSSHTQDRNDRIAATCACSKKDYQIYDLSIRFLDFGDLPYNQRATVPNKKQYCDDNSIPLHNYKGRLNYHPVFLARHALHLIDVYNSTQNPEYLNAAKSISDKLISISLPIASAVFFPYSIEFPLHGYPEDTMHSPWYSGMAQGQILSLFVRLYEMTHENYYLEISSRILNSFDLAHFNDDMTRPWVSCVDDNGFLWLEEYPLNPPAYTLNGMVYAIFGVYDYYRVTKDSKAEQLLRGAIRTIKSNIGRFRTPNGISHYCLRHPKIMRLSYHNVHIRQLRLLYKMTGDVFFRDTANQFARDTEEASED